MYPPEASRTSTGTVSLPWWCADGRRGQFQFSSHRWHRYSVQYTDSDSQILNQNTYHYSDILRRLDAYTSKRSSGPKCR